MKTETETYQSCLLKQINLMDQFKICDTPESKYLKIIEFGRALPPYPPEHKKAENIVQGCQSVLYLRTTQKDGKVFFEVESEALISAGLAALLLAIYNGESPAAVLRCPPGCLDQLGILASLTPGRSNGLASMYLRMKQECLKFLLPSS